MLGSLKSITENLKGFTWDYLVFWKVLVLACICQRCDHTKTMTQQCQDQIHILFLCLNFSSIVHSNCQIVTGRLDVRERTSFHTN